MTVLRRYVDSGGIPMWELRCEHCGAEFTLRADSDSIRCPQCENTRHEPEGEIFVRPTPRQSTTVTAVVTKITRMPPLVISGDES